MEHRVSEIGVLDKAVLVLEALAGGGRSLSELVATTGLPRATAHRLAVALEAHELVRRDGDGRFTLGLRLAALGQAAAGAFPLAQLARPALERLRDDTGESVQLYVRDGDRRRCVASLDSPNELRTIVPVGSLLPLDRGSAGRVLNGHTAAARRGWAESVAEREPGVASVSAPVRGPDGSVVAAVSVSGPIDRTTRQPGRRYAEAVTRAAKAIGDALSRQ
ncbi:MAG: IclR family transcriptional regulator [Acidimicrobiales bacterium]